MTEQPNDTLSYERPHRTRHGQFATRFAIVGALGIVASAAMFVVDGDFLIRLLNTVAGEHLNAALLAVPIIRVASDLLLMSGCVLMVCRNRQSRRAFATFMWTHILLGIIPVLIALTTQAYFSWFENRLSVRGKLLFYHVLFAAIYVGVGWALWKFSNNIHSDFYFRRDIAQIAPMKPVVLKEKAVRPVARFSVQGFDAKTGVPVTYESNAATPELARRAAVVMGLQATDLSITPIDAVDPSDVA